MPGAMTGHKISGWLCAECGVTDTAAEGGVKPEIRYGTDADGRPTVFLLLEAQDGHGEQITIGFDNLAILIGQAAYAASQGLLRGQAFDADHRLVAFLALFNRLQKAGLW